MTTAQRSVVAEPAARTTGALDAVLASLPMSLREAEAGAGGEIAEIAAVAGDPGWVDRAAAAVRSGAAGVVVVDPAAEPVESVRDLQTLLLAQPAVVVVDRPFAGNPVVALVAEQLAAMQEPGLLLEARVVVPVAADLDRVLLDQLALVAGAGSPVETAQVVQWTDRGYLLRASLADGRAAVLTADRTDAVAPSARLRQLGSEGAVEVSIPDSSSARAARAVVTTPTGATLLPTLFESAHRVAWRRVHELVGSGTAAPDLDLLLSDLTIALSLARP